MGVPQIPADAKPSEKAFAPNAPNADERSSIVPRLIDTPAGQAVAFIGPLAIDADGAGSAHELDPVGQSHTALLYPNGASLNPKLIPYVVLPPDFPGAKLGDYAAVSYGGKTVYAIVGDRGPRGVVGEGSMSLAAGLGIPSNPRTGGMSDNKVTYVTLVGSGVGKTVPRTAAEIQATGQARFVTAGLAPK